MESERKAVELWAKAFTAVNTASPDQDLTFAFDITIRNKDIPAILTNMAGKIEGSVNLDPDRENNKDYLDGQLKIMKRAHDPIVIESAHGNKQYVYYKKTQLLTMLSYFPYFQVGVIGLFLAVGYWAFSEARRAEQNQVWVGMAKETAHQLGTPLSSLVAWIEHLKMTTAEDEATQQILVEFRKDIGRLELIAERFSKIGSVPKLEKANIYDQLAKNFTYMNRRASKHVNFTLHTEEEPIFVDISPPLFDWVVENLLKNALDAMGNKGEISAEVIQDQEFVYIDIMDTGKGIPNSKIKTVFEPGFTTKKRGWGLGLSLTKRIIENYHSGKIFVKKSIINEGTTFRISLPKK